MRIYSVNEIHSILKEVLSQYDVPGERYWIELVKHPAESRAAIRLHYKEYLEDAVDAAWERNR